MRRLLGWMWGQPPLVASELRPSYCEGAFGARGKGTVIPAKTQQFVVGP